MPEFIVSWPAGVKNEEIKVKALSYLEAAAAVASQKWGRSDIAFTPQVDAKGVLIRGLVKVETGTMFNSYHCLVFVRLA